MTNSKQLTVTQARKVALAFAKMQRTFYGVNDSIKLKDIKIVNFKVDEKARWFDSVTFTTVGCEGCKPTTIKLGYDMEKASLAFYFD